MPHAVPFASLAHMLPVFISLCHLPQCLWFSPSPSLPLPLSWPIPGLCHPRWDPWVHLGLWRGTNPSAGVLAPGRQAGHCDCSTPSCSFSLFDLRGSFLEFIVFYCTWGGIGGGGGRKKSLFLWGLSVPSETFTKVMFSCLWWSPQPPVGTGGLGHWGLGHCASLSLAWGD